MDDRPLLPGNTRRKQARSNKANPKSRETERRILEAATETFHVKGYISTTLNDIAAAVGIEKGSLYYYIDSKEDLLYAIIQKLHDDAEGNLRRNQQTEGDSRTRLESFVRDHVLNFAQNLSSIRVFYTEYRLVTGERHDRIMAQRGEYERYLTSMIETAIADGWACPNLRPNLASTAILTMVNSIYLWFDPRGDVTIEEIAETLTQQAIQGLTCPPSHDHTTRRTRRNAPQDGKARATLPARATRGSRATGTGG
jgi:AcrR family transcriptional regulator